MAYFGPMIISRTTLVAAASSASAACAVAAQGRRSQPLSEIASARLMAPVEKPLQKKTPPGLRLAASSPTAVNYFAASSLSVEDFGSVLELLLEDEDELDELPMDLLALFHLAYSDEDR